MENRKWLGIDQYGHKRIWEGPCLKGLLKLCCRKSAKKIYRGFKSGPDKHIGYIVAGLWIEVFSVKGIWE